MRKLPALLAAAALATGLAACGDDDDSGAETAAPQPAQTSPAADPPASPGSGGQTGDTTVGMEGLEFVPAEITVKVGSTITWTNESGIPHNVVAEEGADFESDVYTAPKTFEFKPTKAGKIEYVCTLHPGMDGEITVTE